MTAPPNLLGPCRASAKAGAIALLVGMLMLSACQVAIPPSLSPTPDPTDPGGENPSPLHLPTPSFAVQAFLWWQPAQVSRRDIELVKEMGFGWIKQSFAWRDIEGIEKGAYDWYFADLVVEEVEKAGLQLLVRIDRQPFWSQGPGAELYLNGPPKDITDFRDFCYVLADRYRGRIPAYQVWNEPNLSREWGEREPNAAEYVELLTACHSGIKTADPDAVVISAGLAPTGIDLPDAIPDDRFLQEMYAAGAAPHFDILGLNAPGYKAPPEVGPDDAADPDLGWGGHRTFAFRHVEDMRAIMVANGDEDKQVAVLEMGWTTDPRPDSPYHWHSVSEEQQADYLVRAYQYARDNWPWAGLLTAVYIAKFDWTTESEEYWWSITYPGFPETRVRPAYDALMAMPK
ncbi:MAG: beta-galactosidase [Anaerolineales bacterium]|nr:beta-galactosidase [Anaerolineales bacterium]